MNRKMWLTIIIAALGIAIVLLIALFPYLLNLIRCGAPKPEQYNCFKYDTIKALNPIPWEKSKFYTTTLPDSFKQKLQQYNTLAFLIIQNGKIRVEYYNGIDSSTVINSFSAAKSIVSLLLGIAIDQKLINSIDDKVNQYLPWFNDSTITLRHLLTMSSGLDWNENFNNPFSSVIRAFYTNNLMPLIRKVKPLKQPGQQWSYKCINTLLLAQVLEAASGQKISHFAQKYLWLPIGAQHNALWNTDKKGTTKAFCCFFATARDFARLGELILNSGKFNNSTIVSKSYIDQMIQPAGLRNWRNEPVPYGLHIWTITYKGMHLPMLRGMYGQYIIILPEKNAVIVRLGYKRVKEHNYIPIDVPIYIDYALKILE